MSETHKGAIKNEFYIRGHTMSRDPVPARVSSKHGRDLVGANGEAYRVARRKRERRDQAGRGSDRRRMPVAGARGHGGHPPAVPAEARAP